MQNDLLPFTEASLARAIKGVQRAGWLSQQIAERLPKASIAMAHLPEMPAGTHAMLVDLVHTAVVHHPIPPLGV